MTNQSNANSSASQKSNTRRESSKIQIGDRVGRYVLLAKLGAGAMGVVFQAYDLGLNRKVALKFIRFESSRSSDRSQMSRTARSHLMQEAQAMAKVTHPNVVPIYDVGKEGNDVYLAMELVEGETLKNWMQRRQHSRSEAVRIMIAAGRGLAGAHEAGLVHRDFKPENVLIGNDGQIYVADFGLALQSSKKSTRDKEIADEVLGTPAYMSPEQHCGQLATASSDQYSFCVSLFEAVYGVRPYLGKSLKEIGQAIENGCLTEIPKRRRAPRWLHRILLKGLSRSPEERYPSMQVLLADLSSYQENSRHKHIATGMVGLSMVAVVSYHELQGSEDRSTCRLRDSEIEDVWSESTRQKVRQLFSRTSTQNSERSWFKVDELMRRHVKDWSSFAYEICDHMDSRDLQRPNDELLEQMSCMQSQLEELKILSDVLQQADKSIVERSVEVAQGISLSEACLDLDRRNQRISLPEDPRLRSVMWKVKNDLIRARMMYRLGQNQKVEQWADRLLQRAESIDYAPILAEIYDFVAWQRFIVNDYQGAQKYIDQAMVHADMGGNDNSMAWTASDRVFIYGHRLQDAATMDSQIAHAYAHLRRAGDLPSIRQNLLNGIGAAYTYGGRYAEAVNAFREVLYLDEHELDGSPVHVFKSLSNLAFSLEAVHQDEEALYYYRRALTMGATFLGEDHSLLRLPLRNSAIALAKAGNYQEALKNIHRSIAIAESTNGLDNAASFFEYGTYGDLLLFSGQYQQASQEWKRIDRIIRREAMRVPMWDLYRLQALTYGSLGQWEEATEILRKIEIDRILLENLEGSDSTLFTLIELHVEQGKLKEAENIYTRVSSSDIDLLASDRDRDGSFSLVAGNLELARGDLQTAALHYHRAYEQAQKYYYGKENVNLERYERALARLSAKQKEFPQAISWMNQVIVKIKKALPDSPHLLATAYLQLAEIHRQTGHWEAARDAIQLAEEHMVVEEMNPKDVKKIRKLKLRTETRAPSIPVIHHTAEK